jgi:hypothetical protein
VASCRVAKKSQPRRTALSQQEQGGYQTQMLPSLYPLRPTGIAAFSLDQTAALAMLVFARVDPS